LYSNESSAGESWEKVTDVNILYVHCVAVVTTPLLYNTGVEFECKKEKERERERARESER
jgi:hypothetical protein